MDDIKAIQKIVESLLVADKVFYPKVIIESNKKGVEVQEMVISQDDKTVKAFRSDLINQIKEKKVSKMFFILEYETTKTPDKQRLYIIAKITKDSSTGFARVFDYNDEGDVVLQEWFSIESFQPDIVKPFQDIMVSVR